MQSHEKLEDFFVSVTICESVDVATAIGSLQAAEWSAVLRSNLK
jgi:hypothetical protein